MPEVINEFQGEYEFLSNFYLKDFEWDGKVWRSSEHAFQAHKATTPEDREYVRSQRSPWYAKRVGRSINCRPDWEKIKRSVMYEILLAKFTDPKLRQMLLDTGDAELIEGNH